MGSSRLRVYRESFCYTLGGVMLINPSLMSNLTDSVIIFLLAFAVTLLILLVHRWLLPRMGIHIGTEYSKKTQKIQNLSKGNNGYKKQ